MYLRLFRGLLASKPHTARFLKVSNLSGESRTELILLSCFPAVHRAVFFFFFTGSSLTLACQFTIQHLKKLGKKGLDADYSVVRSIGWHGCFLQVLFAKT